MKKLAIVSSSAIIRLTLKKQLEKFFYVESLKTPSNLEKFDLVICDKEFKDKCQGKKIIFDEDIKKPDFIDDEFVKELLEIINNKFGIVRKIELKEADRYVLIGSSTGGPGLIETIAKSLPEDYPYPVCVVQHMPKDFTAKFAKRLNTVSKLNVIEADNSIPVVKGNFIIAKGGWHLHFRKKEGIVYCKLVPNSMNRFFVPSVDEMFFSANEVIGAKKIMAIELTGIGDDGADGMVLLKKNGAYTIAESEKTAAVYGMPKEAYLRGGACKVLDFPDIVKEILNFPNIKSFEC